MEGTAQQEQGLDRDDFWINRNVFVTGCAGFLGCSLTEALLRKHANVVGLVRDVVHNSPFWKSKISEKVNVVRGQLEDYSLLERSVNEYEIDTVFHLAAQAIVGVANRNPLSTFETNIKGTWNLLEACRRSPRTTRIVLASSDKAYGVHLQLPYTEENSLRGTHPYDVSKSCADLIATTYHVTYGLPVCITRCGNFFGGGDLNFSRIVPRTIRSVWRGERPIIRSDGSMIRDYVYVKDGVEACLLLARRMEDSSIHGEGFNFSTETPVSVLALTRRILQLMQREDLEPIILDQAENEIPQQHLSAAKAKRMLGWTHTFTLDQALIETIAWYRDFFRNNHTELS